MQFKETAYWTYYARKQNEIGQDGHLDLSDQKELSGSHKVFAKQIMEPHGMTDRKCIHKE